jgi:hypothetical protein
VRVKEHWVESGGGGRDMGQGEAAAAVEMG